MDQRPERKAPPPARIKKPPNGPVLLPPSPPVAAPSQKAGVTKLRKIECWVFNGVQPTTASAGGTFTKEDITDWLKGPGPTLAGGVRPTAGLRLICREQEDSMKWPFEKATFDAIQNVLGLPKTYSYLTMPKSGGCGTCLEIAGQPSENPSYPLSTGP